MSSIKNATKSMVISHPIISDKTGRPSLFEFFTAELMRSTPRDKSKDGFFKPELYGLCLLRNEMNSTVSESLETLVQTHTLGVVQNQTRPTLTFPLLSLINSKHYSNGTFVDNSFTDWRGSPSFRYQCTKSSKFQRDNLYHDAVKNCKLFGINSYPEIRQRKLCFNCIFLHFYN